MLGYIRSALLTLFIVMACGSAVSVMDIPNPMKNPELCGREGVERSAICDIGNLIDKEGKDVIEGLINGVDPEIAEYAVAIIPKMKIGMFSTVDESAKTYAMTLQDEWGVGSKEHQNGILVFISVDDRVTFISRGKGLESKLTDDNLDSVVDHMRKYLRQQQYGKAIESAILETKDIASGVIIASPPDPNKYSAILVFVVLSGVIVGVACCIQQAESRQLTELKKGQEALARLTREVKNLEDEKYSCTSCPICLEEFGTNPEKQQEITAEASASDPSIYAPDTIPTAASEDQSLLSVRRPVSLQCGHILCFSCCEEYLKKVANSKCPICRAPIDPTGSAPNSGMHNRSSSPSTSHCRHRERTSFSSNTELLYRMDRMRYLYPRVMTPQLHTCMTSAVQSGSQRDFLAAASARETEVGSAISDIVARRAAAASGRKGSSRSSFGGGRSSGGRGGRW